MVWALFETDEAMVLDASAVSAVTAPSGGRPPRCAPQHPRPAAGCRRRGVRRRRGRGCGPWPRTWCRRRRRRWWRACGGWRGRCGRCTGVGAGELAAVPQPRPGRHRRVDGGAATGVESPDRGPRPGLGQGAQLGDGEHVIGEGGFAQGGGVDAVVGEHGGARPGQRRRLGGGLRVLGHDVTSSIRTPVRIVATHAEVSQPFRTSLTELERTASGVRRRRGAREPLLAAGAEALTARCRRRLVLPRPMSYHRRWSRRTCRRPFTGTTPPGDGGSRAC
jgi:hypothetical protein